MASLSLCPAGEPFLSLIPEFCQDVSSALPCLQKHFSQVSLEILTKESYCYSPEGTTNSDHLCPSPGACHTSHSPGPPASPPEPSATAPEMPQQWLWAPPNQAPALMVLSSLPVDLAHSCGLAQVCPSLVPQNPVSCCALTDT